MTHEQAFYALEIGAVVSFLIWFFEFPWQSFCADVARHRYFDLRDQLFLLAANGRVQFDDPLYRALREWLNNRIRLAHMNVFGDLVAVLLAYKGNVPKIPTLGDELQKVGDESVRSELQSIYFGAIQIHINHMAARSPVILVLAVLAPLIILIGLINGGVRACMNWLLNLAEIADDGLEYR